MYGNETICEKLLSHDRVCKFVISSKHCIIDEAKLFMKPLHTTFFYLSYNSSAIHVTSFVFLRHSSFVFMRIFQLMHLHIFYLPSPCPSRTPTSPLPRVHLRAGSGVGGIRVGAAVWSDSSISRRQKLDPFTSPHRCLSFCVGSRNPKTSVAVKG